VGDCLGGDESIGHHAAEQILLAANAEPPRRVETDERLTRHEIDGTRVANRRIELSPEGEAFESSKPLGEINECRPLVMGFRPFIRGIDEHDPARCGAVSAALRLLRHG
jgi:hypothetical protein